MLMICLAAVPLTYFMVALLAVLSFCCWLVWFTGTAESLREVPGVLQALRELLRRRPPK